MTTSEDDLRMIERIERALLLLAYFMERDGDVHLPMFEQFEGELEALKKRQATRKRARALLEARRRLVGEDGDLFKLPVRD